MASQSKDRHPKHTPGAQGRDEVGDPGNIPARTKDVPDAGNEVEQMTTGEKKTRLDTAKDIGGVRSPRGDISSRGGVNEEIRQHNNPTD